MELHFLLMRRAESARDHIVYIEKKVYFILNSLNRVKFTIRKLIYKPQHGFQIFKIVGVKFYDLFL